MALFSIEISLSVTAVAIPFRGQSGRTWYL